MAKEAQTAARKLRIFKLPVIEGHWMLPESRT